MSMISQSAKLRLASWTVLILLAFNVLAVAAEPPVNIHCPCEIKRINETKAEIKAGIEDAATDGKERNKNKTNDNQRRSKSRESV